MIFIYYSQIIKFEESKKILPFIYQTCNLPTSNLFRNTPIRQVNSNLGNLDEHIWLQHTATALGLLPYIFSITSTHEQHLSCTNIDTLLNIKYKAKKTKLLLSTCCMTHKVSNVPLRFKYTEYSMKNAYEM